VCDDASWLMQQFAELLHVPRYALIKTCPRGDDEDFPFHPLIYEEKLYSKTYNCSDDTLITTLEDHTGYIRCLEIHDGKLYTGSGDDTINVYDCSDESLITTLRGHTKSVVAILMGQLLTITSLLMV
jgi:WD40 repeat protein